MDFELPEDETLQNVWAEAGFAIFTGEVPTPLPWQELAAFAEVTGEDLSEYEWRLIREMSEAYCSELHNTNPLSMQPAERFEDG